MANKQHDNFLGQGWSFPPAFRSGSYSIEMVEMAEDIRQSLFLLLSTSPGERFMRPDYGCNLMDLVFTPLTPHTRNQIVDLVKMAILRYEPRISLEHIQLEQAEDNLGLIHIQVEYTIRKTNTRDNMVYPFYLKEGTNIRTQ